MGNKFSAYEKAAQEESKEWLIWHFINIIIKLFSSRKIYYRFSLKLIPLYGFMKLKGIDANSTI